jgi:hypothetical protein
MKNVEFFLVVYNTMQSVESEATFWRNMLPPSSGLKISQTRKQHEADLCSSTLKMEATCSSEMVDDFQ